MVGRENAKKLEERSVPEALETSWVCAAVGALITIPVTMKAYSLIPIFLGGTLGAMVDVKMAMEMRDMKMRYRKLLEAQDSYG